MTNALFKAAAYVLAAVVMLGLTLELAKVDPIYRKDFIAIGLLSLLLVILFGVSSNQQRETNTEAFQADSEAPQQWEHVKSAVRDAGWNAEAKILDIGLIAFWGRDNAYTHRTQPIPSSAEAIQPYFQIQHSNPRIKSIEFSIEDNDGKTVFRSPVMLTPVQQFVTPPARLPLRDLHPSGKWTLRVSVNGTLWAKHRFAWRDDDVQNLNGQIDSDGEVDASILPLLADNYAAPLSLDDLLTNDDSNEQQA